MEEIIFLPTYHRKDSVQQLIGDYTPAPAAIRYNVEMFPFLGSFDEPWPPEPKIDGLDAYSPEVAKEIRRLNAGLAGQIVRIVEAAWDVEPNAIIQDIAKANEEQDLAECIVGYSGSNPVRVNARRVLRSKFVGR